MVMFAYIYIYTERESQRERERERERNVFHTQSTVSIQGLGSRGPNEATEANVNAEKLQEQA